MFDWMSEVRPETCNLSSKDGSIELFFAAASAFRVTAISMARDMGIYKEFHEYASRPVAADSLMTEEWKQFLHALRGPYGKVLLAYYKSQNNLNLE